MSDGRIVTRMSQQSARFVGERLEKAGRLHLKPLCIYSPAEMPHGIARVSDLVKEGDRCLAKAVLLVAAGEAAAVGYTAGEKGICFGALTFLGLAEMSDQMMIDVAVSGEDAAYMKASPEVCRETVRSIGKITPPGRHLVISTCEAAGDVRPLSYLCFGNAEQIRNLCGLIHFGSGPAFGQIDSPWGSNCSLFITYPAGMAAGAPKGHAFIGPTAIDGNPWFPADLMSLGIPAAMAERMAGDVEKSFVTMRPEMAYPAEHDSQVSNALSRRH
ncbi:conserved hypothetical protein [Methanocella arvoryzae MRE50]|uniref:DUF169 domain-containing protein n=1 Tax=Methanocella arvoryzae (strain DSM 22066 / NBRC 105507 / MRE50) TaxID=351160 RepID=Q0W1N5_METAR|nr:conserved hypothetical protein [Methanocella arvoryzae MRE50]